MENLTQTKIEPQFDPFSLEIDRVIYTTNSQLEIWTDCIFGGNDANKAYNLSVSIKFTGNLSLNDLELAVKTLVERHECLRASFSSNGRFMNIYKDLKIEISKYDISQISESDKDQIKNTIINKEVNSLFDLVNGPLFKVNLIKIADFEYLLTLTHHHIIGDGLSFDIILEELSALYSASVENKDPNLPNPERFSEFAERINSLMESSEYKPLEDYWYNIYKESVPSIELPIDNLRPTLRTYNSHRLDFPVDDKLINSLKQVGIRAGCSLVTTLLAAFEVFLNQLTGQNDLVVGFPSSGNILYDMRQLVGDCVNLLPLRSKISPKSSFLEYIKERNSQLFDAYEHQQVSFGHLLKNIAIARDPSRVPLVPVILTVDLNRDIESEFSFTGLSHEFKINPREFATFEIQLHAFRTKNGPSFQWSYNTTLFKPETINQMMSSFKNVLEKVVEDPSRTLEQITTLDYTSEYKILNATSSEYPNLPLHNLIALQAKKTPNKIALSFLDKDISYAALQVKINQTAHYLKAQGVLPGDYIAVSIPRSPELLISFLAIMQCGAAYLPLDPEYPLARLEFMLEDSDAKFLLTSKTLIASLPKWTDTILIEDAMSKLSQFPEIKLETNVNPEDIVYLLYTSGSTGKPKGVPITHKNLVNLLCTVAIDPGIKETDRLLSITTVSFDIVGLELYLPLINGATLILADHETARDGRLLLEKLEKDEITLFQATPVTYQMLLDAGWSKRLPLKLFCCGEALPINLAKELLKRCDELWNMYGPTETTIYSCKKQIKEEDTLITIGVPIANTQIYIINDQGKLMPSGNIGEIAIGGDGVGKGYWKRPELTAEKFIKNEFSNKKNDILYRTGDLGKLLPNNEIECLGRIDQQVKIRGYRIETGEIEQALMALPRIKSAVVLANSDSLIAHIVPESHILNTQDEISIWRKELASQLPAYFIPNEFNILEKMPSTLNGKIDRKALLEYKSKNKTLSKQDYNAPRTDTEKLIANIWKESLNLEQIDIFNNFFQMGGHSIMAVNIMVKIEKQTGKRIPLSALFQHSTVEKFAELLNIENEITSDYLVPIKPNGSKTPFFIVHGAGLNILNFANVINHFDDDQPIYGFQGIGPNGFDNWFQSIEDMAACYIESIIKINPEGPYAIAGFSFGGVVAFEMARQLKEQGKTVSIIALLDSYLDSSYYYSPNQKKLIKYYDRTRRRLDFLKEMLMSWEAVKLRVKGKKVHIQKRYFGLKDLMTEQETIALEEFIIADRMVKKIVDRYRIIPQEFEVDLFRSKDDTNYKLDPTHLGWKKAALKGVNIHNITGDHLNIVAPPNDKILARMIQEILDKRHGKP